MTHEEAKFILQSYRSNGRDVDDPIFAEALARLKTDPELARWFEAERALDAALSTKLRSVPVPSELRERILGGRKVVKSAKFGLRSALFALAGAAAVVILLVVFRPFSDRTGFAAYRLHVARMIDDLTYRLDYHDPKIANVRAWLKDHQGFSDFVAPDNLKGHPTFGCQVFQWNGHPATLVCFLSDQGIVHVFTIDATAFPDAPPEDPPLITRVAHQQIASWTQGGKTYVLAGVRDLDSLKKLL